MDSKDKLSRRNFLLGLGMLGAGTTMCVCAGTVGTGLFLLSQQTPPDLPIQTPLTMLSSPSPRFTMPPVISRSSWGALPPNHGASNESGFYADSNLAGWRIYDGDIDAAYQTVIIHHSAFYENNDLDTLLEIQTVHRNQRRWADVAYHFLIGQNGLIYEGRDWYVRGTHVEAYNSGSLGICLLGNFMTQAPTEVQLNSTLALVNWASERLSLSHIASHRHFNPQTLCPGDNLFPYIEQFAQPTGLIIGTEGYIAPSDSAFCSCCDCMLVT